MGDRAAARVETPGGPPVRVNQVGYVPGGPKRATVLSEATEPLAWRLIDAAGGTAAEGYTTPRGRDPSAGLDVHTLDATAFTGCGTGFRFQVGELDSHAFDIDGVAYERLRVDALSFFYPQRSGVEILGEVAGEAYARPAGHLSRFGGDEVNQGDLEVPCLPADEAVAQYGSAVMAAYGDAWPGGYRLDVSGGWYDAGDLGKYVVNGGISVYQLLSTYERATLAPSGDPAALADGTLRIPESGNGHPDLLDEVRWELRFLLSMQVPDGEPLAGMAHHKMSDLRWVGLPMAPHEDPQPRYLHPPTTAATLNLAAVAAQATRIHRPFDPGFADELLAAARRAWDAADANPALYAPSPTHPDPGSGPYDDDDVSDEFYWAAAQLYLTTGEQRFLQAVVASEHHTAPAEVLFRREGFDWQHTAAAGRLDLATVPSELPDRDRVIGSVLEGADRFLTIQSGEPFGHPYAPASGEYDWGSNHLLINNLVVVATAFDLSGDRRYLDGVLEGLDYLFGRNALGVSYVTGYGTVDVHNQHSRWYAHQLDPTTPNPPPGTLSGGPNSRTQDPVAAERVGGRPAQQCFVDDIESWSTNELTINWNAALAWLASFVADQVDGSPRAARDPALSSGDAVH